MLTLIPSIDYQSPSERCSREYIGDVIRQRIGDRGFSFCISQLRIHRRAFHEKNETTRIEQIQRAMESRNNGFNSSGYDSSNLPPEFLTNCRLNRRYGPACRAFALAIALGFVGLRFVTLYRSPRSAGWRTEDTTAGSSIASLAIRTISAVSPRLRLRVCSWLRRASLRKPVGSPGYGLWTRNLMWVDLNAR